jgi:hypothetical protein
MEAMSESGNGILGHHFEKILKSFAQFYSQSLLLADFKETHPLLWFQNEGRELEFMPRNLD